MPWSRRTVPSDTLKPRLLCATALRWQAHATGKPFVMTVVDLEGFEYVEVTYPERGPSR